MALTSSRSGRQSFLLDELAAIGPFFALHDGGADEPSVGRPVSELIAPKPSGRDLLGEAIDDVASRLGTRARWIAASILFQSWAARLTSIYAGSIVLGSAIPDLAASRLRYRLQPSGPVELTALPLEAVDVDAGWQRLLEGHLRPLNRAVRMRVRIGGRLLDGNVASALAGSIDALARDGRADLHQLIEQPWALPGELAALGNWVETSEGICYARTTCCGYEQLPAGSRCGDCSLLRRGSKARRDAGSPGREE